MARKITVNMYMTLDGYGEFPQYPGWDAPQTEPDLAFKEMWVDRYKDVDTIIYGKNSYQGHTEVHALSKRKTSDPEFLFDFSRFIEGCQKIVISNSLKKVDWVNTRIERGDLADIVERIRQEPGKNIIVDSGPSLVSSFIREGLADEYRMAIFPVILGNGHHYWSQMSEQRTLKLVSTKSLEYGELYLRYEDADKRH